MSVQIGARRKAGKGKKEKITPSSHTYPAAVGLPSGSRQPFTAIKDRINERPGLMLKLMLKSEAATALLDSARLHFIAPRDLKERALGCGEANPGMPDEVCHFFPPHTSGKALALLVKASILP